MKVQISIKDAVGKTIEKVLFGYEEDLLVLFTDGTFTYIRADRDEYDNDKPLLYFTPPFYPLDRYSDCGFSRATILENGLLTEAEIKAHDEQEAAHKEAVERKQYEALRAKFEQK